MTPIYDQNFCMVWFHSNLTVEDKKWLEYQLSLAGVKPPEVDMSWVSRKLVK